jgi:hypothetical protein
MKRPQEQRKEFEQSNCTIVQNANSSRLQYGKKLNSSDKTGLAVYMLLARGWFPWLSLGLLATVLGTVGILPSARADELVKDWSVGTGDGEAGSVQQVGVASTAEEYSSVSDRTAPSQEVALTTQAPEASNPEVQQNSTSLTLSAATDLLEPESEQGLQPVELSVPSQEHSLTGEELASQSLYPTLNDTGETPVPQELQELQKQQEPQELQKSQEQSQNVPSPEFSQGENANSKIQNLKLLDAEGVTLGSLFLKDSAVELRAERSHNTQEKSATSHSFNLAQTNSPGTNSTELAPGH